VYSLEVFHIDVYLIRISSTCEAAIFCASTANSFKFSYAGECPPEALPLSLAVHAAH
jgi:hypothetical protein